MLHKSESIDHKLHTRKLFTNHFFSRNTNNSNSFHTGFQLSITIQTYQMYSFFWNVTNSTAICGLPQLILSNKLFFHRLMYRIRNGLKLPCIGVVKKRIFYLYMGMQVVIWPHQRFSCAMLSFKMDSTTSLWSIMDQLAEPPVTFH